jgi:hypothetical protein
MQLLKEKIGENLKEEKDLTLTFVSTETSFS